MRLAPSMEPGRRINSGACLRPDRRYRRCSGNAVRAPPRHIHLEGWWSVTGPLLGRSLSVTAASPDYERRPRNMIRVRAGAFGVA